MFSVSWSLFYFINLLNNNMPMYMIKYIVNKSLHLCRNYSITYSYNLQKKRVSFVKYSFNYVFLDFS